MSIQYTADHEWIDSAHPEAATVGITLHAQDALGDVVFVDLPEIGARFAKGEVAGVVESVKGAADAARPATAWGGPEHASRGARPPAGPKKGANARRAGEDVAVGMVAIPQGRVLRAQDIALASALGIVAA